MNAIRLYLQTKLKDIRHDYSVWKYSTKLRIIHIYRTYRDKLNGVIITNRIKMGLQHRGRQTTDNTVIKPIRLNPKMKIEAKVYRAKEDKWYDFGVISETDKKGD